MIKLGKNRLMAEDGTYLDMYISRWSTNYDPSPFYAFDEISSYHYPEVEFTAMVIPPEDDEKYRSFNQQVNLDGTLR